MPNKTNQKELLRLNKFLAKWAGFSRRKADEAIKKGEVFVNSKKISQPAVFVNVQKDVVRLNKQIIKAQKNPPVYILFNKPTKVLTTNYDPKGRPTVMDYVKSRKKERLFPIGRLDWDSEGLLLLTNDGDFSDSVLHPGNQVPKTYLVKVKGRPGRHPIGKLIRGVSTPLGKKRALFVKIFIQNSSSCWVKVIISEGKKRQIRLMFDKIGFPVCRLRRTAIGRLKMNKLVKGACVRLTEKEVAKVFQWPKEIQHLSQRKKHKRED